MMSSAAVALPVLTLPGIAGIALTLGMAVDANVLINERIREELRAGKRLVTAIEAGYERAFVTILDSNATTVIAAAILFFFGTGAIRGFGVTLAAGIIVSMYSAVVVTRLFFDLIVAKFNIQNLHMMTVIKMTSIDFLGKRRMAIALSLVLIVGTWAFMGVRGFRDPTTILGRISRAGPPSRSNSARSRARNKSGRPSKPPACGMSTSSTRRKWTSRWSI